MTSELTVPSTLNIRSTSHETQITHVHTAESRARGNALEAVLNGLPTPMLLVTGRGGIMFMNTAAQRLIMAADGLMVDADGLRAVLSDETRLLRTLIGETARNLAVHGLTGGQMLRVSRPYDRPRLEVLVSPLSVQGDKSPSQPPLAAVFVTDPQRHPAIENRTLTKSYGLTPAEAKVAVAVCRGLSGKEICRQLDISYNTLKTHMKHVYAKTSTRHQSDLVRLLSSRPAFGRCAE